MFLIKPLFMILKNYKKFSDAEYVAFCTRLQERCTTDERFASLETRTTELSEQLSAFEEVLSRMPGSKEVTIERNEIRAALTSVVDRLAMEVDLLSNNNTEMELAAGFDVRKTSEPNYGPLERPVFKKIHNGVRSGDVKIVLEPVKGAVNYAIEQSIDGGQTWTNGSYSTSSRIELTGYQAGMNVQFRICALGTRDRKSDKCEASIWIS